MDQVCPVLYEKLHSELMISQSGLKYQQQELSHLKQGTKPENGQVYKANKDCWFNYENLQLKKLIYDLPPSYNEMIVDTLYYPTNITFPFTEYFYKKNNDTLVVFQVTRQKTSPKYLLQSTFTEYLEKIDFPEDKVEDKLKLVFIPGPK